MEQNREVRLPYPKPLEPLAYILERDLRNQKHPTAGNLAHGYVISSSGSPGISVTSLEIPWLVQASV